MERQQPPWQRKRDFIAPSEGALKPGPPARGQRRHFSREGSPRNTSVTPPAGNNPAAYSALKTTTVTNAVFAFFWSTPTPGNASFCPHRIPHLRVTNPRTEGQPGRRHLPRARPEPPAPARAARPAQAGGRSARAPASARPATGGTPTPGPRDHRRPGAGGRAEPWSPPFTAASPTAPH